LVLLSLSPRDLRYLHSSPTRRSSDLSARRRPAAALARGPAPGALEQLAAAQHQERDHAGVDEQRERSAAAEPPAGDREPQAGERSEEHTSELQSRGHLVCRLLLEKKK